LAGLAASELSADDAAKDLARQATGNVWSAVFFARRK
jgi:hypothetical protein